MDDYRLILRAEELGEVAEAIAACPYIGLDIETTSLVPFMGKIRLVQIQAGERTFVIDLFETKTLGPVLEAIRSESVIKIIQNAKFEQKWFLHHYGLELWPIFDTYRASALLYNGKNLGHNLYDIYARELSCFPTTADLGNSDWGGPLAKEQYDYAASDVVRMPALRDVLRTKVFKNGLKTAALIEFGVVLPEAAVELQGIFLDKERWLALAEENKKGAAEQRQKLIWNLPSPSEQLCLAGIEPPFNLDSNEQMVKSLRKLGIKRTIKEEDGTKRVIPIDTTTEIVLAQFATEFPIIKEIFKYREFSKSVSSFGPEYLKHVNPVTGRIHPNYFPFTGAGRYACSDPNIQQIPRDKRFRSCFRAKEGHVFVLADYKGIEMVIATELSGDETLRAVFAAGKDAHQYTAAIVNDIPEDQVTKPQRQAAKAVNFGLIYGMGAEKLVLYAQSNYGVTMSLDDARKFIKRYFNKYSSIRRWQERAIRDGKRAGFTRTLSGRIRYLDPEKTFSEWLNTPDQGTGADGLKTSLRNVYFRLKKYEGRVKMCHHVHDEIITECENDPELIAAVKEELKAGMREGMEAYVKKTRVDVDPGHGDSWASAK